MPCGDGTGPWWIDQPNYRSTYKNGCFRRRYWQRFYHIEPITLTKEEQRKILKEELEEVETEKKIIEKRLKEIEAE